MFMRQLDHRVVYSNLLVIAFLSNPCLADAPAQTPEYVWIEGESLANPPEGFKVAGWGNKHYLSGENWLNGNLDAKQAENLPPRGLLLNYPFTLRSAGQYEIWGRVGYEFVRSPMRWRIDQGEWGVDGPENLTTDLMSLADWNEVAWVKLGTMSLPAGKHSLQIQFERRVFPGKKQPERILTGLDCFCIYKGNFRPNGKHKPDENWQEEIDKQAASHTFQIKNETLPRTVLPLVGTWQIARFDELEIKDRSEPVRELPADWAEFSWKGVTVPGNRDQTRPDLLYCHRFLYRTKVNIPANRKGQSSFVLRFPSTSMIASVFVNGRYCGGSTAPCAAWEADATSAIKPGTSNEIIVAIKDSYYALAQTAEGKSARYMFNYPTNWFYHNGGLGPTRFADFPVLVQVQGAGIFETPTLTVTGPVYVADVFAKPSVARKELGLEITLKNTSSAPLKVEVTNVVDSLRESTSTRGASGLQSEKRFAPKELTIPAGKDQTFELTEKWENPRLWWPDQPQLQEVLTRLTVDGKTVDLKKTRFGFREWTWTGRHFTLNGVPWHFRADLLHNGKIKDKDQAAADWKKSGINTIRYWGHQPWVGSTQEETLDHFDSIGMPIRRTGIFDGEVASYLLVEQKDGKTVARKAVFDNWIKQLEAWVKAERNHPSIFVWSIENEITFINIRNFGWLPACEPEIRRAVEAVMKVDPTRPAMIDGGDALSDASLPIYGNHYNEAHFRNYPDEAYTMDLAYTRHKKDPRANPWPIGDDRPLFLGESFYANGHPPAAYAALIGEAAFLGRNQAEPGVRLFARMLTEGYRWHGLAGFHFWMSGDSPANFHYKAFQPVCALVREWNGTFGSGQEVTRTLKIFNDTRFNDPIELNWTLNVGGKKITEGKSEKVFNLAPGTAEVTTLKFNLPRVKERTAGELTLILGRKGQEVFRDTKPIQIIVKEGTIPSSLANGEIAVFDPKGTAIAHLQQRGIPFTEVKSLDNLSGKARVILIGHDALTPRQATDPLWISLAAQGKRILVLDQEHPLHFQAIPADLEPTEHSGRIAFPENPEHPAFTGLGKEDFFCWSGDHIVYRRVYKKASRGSRSLLQCDDELSCTALAECPVREGLLVLSQANIGTRLGKDPVATRLFDNLLNHCLTYKLAARTTVAVLPEGDLRGQLLDRIGLRYNHKPDVVQALTDPGAEIVIADASPGNLAKLAGALDKLQTFYNRGGNLMLWGLTPEGLADFNKLVGFNHVIRPFTMERVTLPALRDPLLAGLTTRDVVLESAEKIYPWAADRYPGKDGFTFAVDLDDIAPFARSAQYGHGWGQMTNGLTSADSWKFIFYHDLSKADPKPKWSAELPKEEEIVGFSIILNTHYHLIKKMRLLFDDKEAEAVTLDLKPGAELRQDFDIKPRKFKSITLEPVDWETIGKQPVIGVDNIWIKVRRDEAYARKVVPLLNIGALVKYRLGTRQPSPLAGEGRVGGILLNQLRILPTEANPVNAEKKQTIVATLLRNLGATFAEKAAGAGASLVYTPIPLDEKCNQYLTADKGWPASDGLDLGHLPVGEQKFTGVNYLIRDFRTSPLPACIMLAAPGVKRALPKSVEGIPVGRKADMIFFLHTFHRTREWKPANAKDQPPLLFVYVIHYADGQSVEVPVRYDHGVSHWITPDPQGLPEASVAWAAPFAKDATRQALVYQMGWTNPRPEMAIGSIEIRYDQKTGSSYGVPAVLGITAGTVGR